MANPFFKFKQFTVFHDLCAMKVGIDGVLLGAWAAIGKEAAEILDVGTGSGLIALMLAQRNPRAFIDAIDLDPSAVAQAKKNSAISPWSERIRVIQMAFQDFARKESKRYDFIISNPPFFISSLKAPDASRSAARHTDSLAHEELVLLSKTLLNGRGKLCLILPVAEGETCLSFAERNGFFCEKKVLVFPKPQAEAKRVLLQFSLEKCVCELSELTIETSCRHVYTEDFKALAKDFYLKL